MGVLFYFRGEPARIAVLSALLSLLILNGNRLVSVLRRRQISY